MPLSSSIRFKSNDFSSYAGQSIMPSLILSACRSDNVHAAPNSRLIRFTDITIYSRHTYTLSHPTLCISYHFMNNINWSNLKSVYTIFTKKDQWDMSCYQPMVGHRNGVPQWFDAAGSWVTKRVAKSSAAVIPSWFWHCTVVTMSSWKVHQLNKCWQFAIN